MKSWKTSLVGVLGGLVLAFGPSVGARLSGDTTAPPITFQQYGAAVTLMALGLLSKDYNKTNAPTPVQTQTAEPTAPPPPLQPSTPSNFPSTR